MSEPYVFCKLEIYFLLTEKLFTNGAMLIVSVYWVCFFVQAKSQREISESCRESLETSLYECVKKQGG